MKFLYWTVVCFLLVFNFGLFSGVMFTISLMILADVLKAYFLVKDNAKVADIRQNNVLVTVELVEHNGQNVILVYNALTKKFVTQGIDYEAIKNELIQKFEGKSIFVKYGEMPIQPLYLSSDLINRATKS